MTTSPLSGCVPPEGAPGKSRFLWLSPWLCLLLLPAALHAQQAAPLDDGPASNAVPTDSHANRPAPRDLLQEAGLRPSSFIGKMLVLHDEDGEMEVGPVLDLRRHKQNQRLYLIVDATRYFKTETEYAVAVNDLTRLEETRVIASEAPGMHLRGIEYYADDYADIETTVAE